VLRAVFGWPGSFWTVEFVLDVQGLFQDGDDDFRMPVVVFGTGGNDLRTPIIFCETRDVFQEGFVRPKHHAYTC